MQRKIPDSQRPRAQDLGIDAGLLPRGIHNTITDVPGVRVGHVSLVKGDGGPLRIGQGPVQCAGVTIILPHGGNTFKQKVNAAAHVINGFGKSVGLPQVMELGVIESPIALTNTLNVWSVADALADYLSQQNPGVFSFNPVVGECNDSFLNDILGRHVKSEHVEQAIQSASSPSVSEGNTGAGVGMRGFGWKGGIGTASRLCRTASAASTVGVLVLTNTGDPRELRIGGVDVGHHILPPGYSYEAPGSIMIVVATDARIDSRQLGRMARRAALGLGRVGAIASHGSGDFVIAFSNAAQPPDLGDDDLTSLFRGVVEATEEAIVNSLLRAETLTGRDGNTCHAIPIDRLKELLSIKASA